MRYCLGLLLGLSLTASLATSALAASESSVDTGQVAWILTCATLVLFMTLPGLGLFYGGLVRAKNVLSILMQCFAICCVVSVLWIACGYSLVFGDDAPLIGPLSKAFLSQLGAAKHSSGLPESVFALYQMTFAVITPALIIGAFPERITFQFLLVFTGLWFLLVYVPVAHWVWGEGWLAGMGVLDYAGGIVVHTTAGVSALVAAVMIGARRGFPNSLVPPHSPGMTMAGAGMLWVGWFGFNGGSGLVADGSAASAILATHMAACSGAIVWAGLEWSRAGKPTSIGLVTGCVAGLATITPAAGFVGPAGAMALGALGGLVCFFATLAIKQHARMDDTLDVFAVHGVGGILGSLLLSVFGAAVLGGTGLPRGSLQQFGVQALAVAAVALWSLVVTAALIACLRLIMRIRVTHEEEYEGLDLSSHSERGYDYT